MKERIRTATGFKSIQGAYVPPFGVEGPQIIQTKSWKCTDFIEKKKNEVTGLTPVSNLDMVKAYFKPNILNYRLYWYGYYEGGFTNFACRNFESHGDPPLGWTYMEGTTAALTSELLAKTNPFRYVVSVPVMIAELVEAASLLKLASNNWISLIGSAHLNSVFGWEPAIQDIKALAKITESIESRIKEFNSLILKGGLRRKIQLTKSKDQSPSEDIPIISNVYGVWYGKVSTRYSTKVWGSVRWVPNRTTPIDLSKLTAFNEAARVVLDLRTPDASTIWEAIPFSWLVDYFLNVGDTLQALEDTDKVLPTDICIMRERTVTIDVKGIPHESNGAPWTRISEFSDGEFLFEHKLREVVDVDDVSDLLSFGIMTKGQATNLIALLMSLTRFKR